MMSIFREPLVHFLLAGAAIFVLSSWFAPDGDDERTIWVSAARQDNIAQLFERTWQRPPSADELSGLIDDFVREEIAYRESRKMLLDRDDIVIRRRLRQKLELLAEDIASLVPPSDEQLQVFLDDHRADYRQPAQLTVEQLYFSTDDGVDQAQQRATSLLAALQSTAPPEDPAAAASASMLPAALAAVDEREIDRIFGQGFAEKALAGDPGVWSGPVRSGFGYHLTRVTDIIPGYFADLSEVRDEVQRDWLYQQRNSAIDALYERFAENYDIGIEAR